MAVHDVLSATLGREGYLLLHARDGAEALAIMRRDAARCRDARRAGCRRSTAGRCSACMKSEPELQNIPVVMLTIVDDRNLGFSLGASEFMTKPIDRGSPTRAGAQAHLEREERDRVDRRRRGRCARRRQGHGRERRHAIGGSGQRTRSIAMARGNAPPA